MWFIPLKDESVLCAEIPELFLFTGRDARDAWSVLRRECVL